MVFKILIIGMIIKGAGAVGLIDPAVGPQNYETYNECMQSKDKVADDIGNYLAMQTGAEVKITSTCVKYEDGSEKS